MVDTWHFEIGGKVFLPDSGFCNDILWVSLSRNLFLSLEVDDGEEGGGFGFKCGGLVGNDEFAIGCRWEVLEEECRNDESTLKWLSGLNANW